MKERVCKALYRGMRSLCIGRLWKSHGLIVWLIVAFWVDQNGSKLH